MPDQAATNARAALALSFQELLTVIVRLRANRQRVDDAEAFRSNTVAALQTAEQQSRAAGYTGAQFRTALLAVVGFLDESILNSKNPTFADWPRRPLTEQIFGHHKAGEVFFENVSSLLSESKTPAHADVLEVYYLCLLLGFGGRYSGNRGELRSVRESIADKIRQIRGHAPEFSPDWAPATQAEVRPRRDPWIRPLVFIATASVVLALSLLVAFHLSLSSGSSQLISAAAEIPGIQ